MPRANEKTKTNNKRVLTLILPILLALLAILLLAMRGIASPSIEDDQPLFEYDFRSGTYPDGTSGDAEIIEESGYYNLYFDEIGDQFVSGSFSAWRTLTIDIHVSGLNLVGTMDESEANPVFTIAGYDQSNALVRSATIDEVTVGAASRVSMDGRGISYFLLTLTDYARESTNPGLALGVLISQIVGQDLQ
jgi:hypothetical protein